MCGLALSRLGGGREAAVAVAAARATPQEGDGARATAVAVRQTLKRCLPAQATADGPARSSKARVAAEAGARNAATADARTRTGSIAELLGLASARGVPCRRVVLEFGS